MTTCEAPSEFKQLAVRVEIVQEVSIEALTGEDADATLVSLRVVTSILQRRPRLFEKQAMLRIECLRFTRSEAEERSVKQFDIFK